MKQVTETALSIFLQSVKYQIKTSDIDAILNLPSQFRWYAAKELLNDYENEVIKLAGIRKTKPEKFNQIIAYFATMAIQHAAFYNADFGRFQSTHKGTNVLPEKVGIRTEIGERYQRRFTSKDLYADFFLSISDKDNFELLIKTSSSEKQHKISFYDLDGKFLKQDAKGVKFDFIFNHPLFKKCRFTFDRNQVAILHNGDIYHIEQSQVFCMTENHEPIIKRVITAFQNRKRGYKKDHYFNALNLSEIIMTFEDSTKSGNCEIGTKQFASTYFANELKENTPITAQMVWNTRKDEFTKRAILQAAKK